MDMLKKLSTGTKLTLAALVLYFIDGFLPWQTFSAGSISGSITEWHGIGVLAALIGIVLLVWEGLPLFATRPAVGALNPRLISLVLAAALVVFTLIRTLSTYTGWSHGWASWVGLILSVVAGAGILMQAQAEGFQMPKMGGVMGGGGSSADASPPSPPSAPPAPPVSESPPSEPTGDAPSGDS